MLSRRTTAALVVAIALLGINRRAKRSGKLSSWLELLALIPTMMKIKRLTKEGKIVQLTPMAAMMKFRMAGKRVDEMTDFKPRDSDIYVAIPGKSGTTVLQHICHQLRVGGKLPDWEDQYSVMPWLELTDAVNAHGIEKFESNNMEQVAHPRVFKSHLELNLLPIQGKKIYCFRKLEDVIISLHAFIPPMMKTTWIPLDHWVTQMLLFGMPEQNLKKLLGWWEHRNDSNVLFLFYDDILEDHAGTVRRIAEFMEIVQPGQDDAASRQLLATVVEQSTHAWMSSPEQKHRFDEKRLVRTDWERQGHKFDSTVSLTGKVRKGGGQTGQGKAKLSPGARAAISRCWQNTVQPVLGFASYEEMRAAWTKELAARHGSARAAGVTC